MWAKLGECKHTPNFMLASCRLSCGRCKEMDDATYDHTSLAIDLDEAGDVNGAVHAFRAATRFSSEAFAWENLAECLLTVETNEPIEKQHMEVEIGNCRARATHLAKSGVEEILASEEARDSRSTTALLLPVTVKWDDAGANYGTSASQMAQQSDFDFELQYLLAATHYNGFEAAIWVRLGDSIMRGAGYPVSQRGGVAWAPEKADPSSPFPGSIVELAFACEALAAYELAHALDRFESQLLASLPMTAIAPQPDRAQPPTTARREAAEWRRRWRRRRRVRAVVG
jgi:hypothetical protein